MYQTSWTDMKPAESSQDAGLLSQTDVIEMRGRKAVIQIIG